MLKQPHWRVRITCTIIIQHCIINCFHINFIIYTAPDLNEATFASKLRNIKNWWKLGIALYVLWGKLDEIERIHSLMVDRLKAVYRYFKQMHPYASWRSVIWGLDECDDTDLADKIRSYAAADHTAGKYKTFMVIGVSLICMVIFFYHFRHIHADPSSLTVENILEVLKHLKSRWYGKMSHILAMPPSKKMEIKQRFSTEEEQLKLFVEYIYAFHPRMSWETLAGALHSMEEKEALEFLKAKGYLIKRDGIY